MRVLRRTNNTVYEVTADGLEGGRAAFRAHRPDYRTVEQTRAELTLLEEIAPPLADAGVRVPSPIRTPDGDLTVDSGGRHYDLISWVDGEVRRPTMGLGPSGCRALGHALACIHSTAQTVRLSGTLPVWDAAALSGDSSPPRPGPFQDAFTSTEAALLRDVERRAVGAFRRLDDGERSRGVIHADFILGNCLLRRTGSGWSVGVIDFDDCGIGHFAYDVATLADNLADFPNRRRNIAEFLGGYRSVRQLPDGFEAELPVLMATRHAASCLWAAAMLRRGAGVLDYRSLIAGRIEQIRVRLASSFSGG